MWLIGLEFSVDEITLGFKGKNKDKLRITYNNEGDGFQADSLRKEGYTYQVYMRNNPAPLKYLKQGLSPLHLRFMNLFDSLKDEHNHCAMENLYYLTYFCRSGYNHKNKLLCSCVTIKGWRGISDSVKQFEVERHEDQLKVRGTVESAVIEGNPGCPNLVVSRIYDTNPVH